MEDQQHLAMRQQPFSQKQRYLHKRLLHHYTVSLFSTSLYASHTLLPLAPVFPPSLGPHMFFHSPGCSGHLLLLLWDWITISFPFIIYHLCLDLNAWCTFPFAPIRLKPVHKVEGMTNGTAAGAGQQQQQQQGSGHVDISTQVQQYQQFLGEFSEERSHCQWMTLFFKKKCES